MNKSLYERIKDRNLVELCENFEYKLGIIPDNVSTHLSNKQRTHTIGNLRQAMVLISSRLKRLKLDNITLDEYQKIDIERYKYIKYRIYESIDTYGVQI